MRYRVFGGQSGGVDYVGCTLRDVERLILGHHHLGDLPVLAEDLTNVSFRHVSR